jgi:hypothetical protein
MEKLIEQAKQKGDIKLVTHLMYLDFIMDRMIEVEKMTKNN